VGDVAFQKKCIGKMSDIASQGRTVLFVSHNLGAVKELCQTSLVIANGKLDFYGPVADGLVRYSRSLADSEEQSSLTSTGWRFIGIDAGDQTNHLSPVLPLNCPLTVKARLELLDDYQNGFLFLVIENSMGDTMIHRRVDIEALCSGKMAAGVYTISATLPPLPLAPGVYTLHLKMRADNSQGVPERYLSDKLIFETPGTIEGLSRALLAPDCVWEAVHRSLTRFAVTETAKRNRA
jgi:lipopolysaccharide transport system ATP-binding protein